MPVDALHGVGRHTVDESATMDTGPGRVDGDGVSTQGLLTEGVSSIEGV